VLLPPRGGMSRRATYNGLRPAATMRAESTPASSREDGSGGSASGRINKGEIMPEGFESLRPGDHRLGYQGCSSGRRGVRPRVSAPRAKAAAAAADREVLGPSSVPRRPGRRRRSEVAAQGWPRGRWRVPAVLGGVRLWCASPVRRAVVLVVRAPSGRGATGARSWPFSRRSREAAHRRRRDRRTSAVIEPASRGPPKPVACPPTG